MITVYTIERRDGKEDEEFSTQDYEEARAYAQERAMCVIANEFTFADSYPLDDFTDQLTDDEQFFYDYADYSPDPGTRTADENQRRRARELAAAEQLLNRCPAAWITWDDEDNPDTDEYRQYQAVLWVQLGTAPGQDKAALLASAERIAAGPDDPYRRVGGAARQRGQGSARCAVARGGQNAPDRRAPGYPASRTRLEHRVHLDLRSRQRP